MKLADKDLIRYNRHLILEQIGVEGQEKFFNEKVLVIGTGGLGSPVSLYLTAAGIGTIGIVDSDVVDLSNLQRQVIHFTKDLNRLKVDSAAEKMVEINPDIKVIKYNYRINTKNIREIIKNYDFFIVCTDNFATEFLINDACVMENKPFSHGGVLKFEGQTMTVISGKNACYRCVFLNPPSKELSLARSRAGILGSIAGILGTIQATGALKYFSNVGDLLLNQLLSFNSLSMNFRTSKQT